MINSVDMKICDVVWGLIAGVLAEGKTDYLDNIVLCEGHLNVWLSNNNHLITNSQIFIKILHVIHEISGDGCPLSSSDENLCWFSCRTDSGLTWLWHGKSMFSWRRSWSWRFHWDSSLVKIDCYKYFQHRSNISHV